MTLGGRSASWIWCFLYKGETKVEGPVTGSWEKVWGLLDLGLGFREGEQTVLIDSVPKPSPLEQVTTEDWKSRETSPRNRNTHQEMEQEWGSGLDDQVKELVACIAIEWC